MKLQRQLLRWLPVAALFALSMSAYAQTCASCDSNQSICDGTASSTQTNSDNVANADEGNCKDSATYDWYADEDWCSVYYPGGWDSEADCDLEMYESDYLPTYNNCEYTYSYELTVDAGQYSTDVNSCYSAYIACEDTCT